MNNNSEPEDQTNWEATRFTADKLAAWLKTEQWSRKQLIRWLQGYDFTFHEEGEEPYEGLLRYLPMGRDRNQAERQLASRVAEVFKDHPEKRNEARRPREFLYNLLMLSAALESPEELCKPLLEMYDRRVLDGDWRGISLRSALRDALVTNQLDSGLNDIWIKMIRGEDDVLPGNEYDGIEGLLMKPKTNDARGEPDVDSLLPALTEVVARIESQRDRHVRLQAIFDLIKFTYPKPPFHWDITLLHHAHKTNWSEWAVNTLPALMIEPSEGNGRAKICTWSSFVQAIAKRFPVDDLKSLCQDKFRQVICEEEEAEGNLISISRGFEIERREYPYMSTEGMEGAARDWLCSCEVAYERANNLRVAGAIRDYRMEFMKSSH